MEGLHYIQYTITQSKIYTQHSVQNIKICVGFNVKKRD